MTELNWTERLMQTWRLVNDISRCIPTHNQSKRPHYALLADSLLNYAHVCLSTGLRSVRCLAAMHKSVKSMQKSHPIKWLRDSTNETCICNSFFHGVLRYLCRLPTFVDIAYLWLEVQRLARLLSAARHNPQLGALTNLIRTVQLTD